MTPQDINEIKIISHYTSLNELEIISNKHFFSALSIEIIDQINTAICNYREGFPLDYIFGEIIFLNKKFLINKSVLIPREETEYWVKRLIHKFQTNIEYYKTQTLVDIATGSGVIGISLKEFFAQVYISDIDLNVLEIAKKNLELNLKSLESLKKKIVILQSDLLQNYPENLKIDILTANLPYVPESDQKNATKNKIEYEPDIAIYSGLDGLDLFKQLIKQIYNWNKKHQIKEIYLELDPRNIKTAKEIAKETLPNYNWQIWLDQNKLERVLIGII